MSEPRTEAGRALLAREAYNARSFAIVRVADIIAIEAEAEALHAKACNVDIVGGLYLRGERRRDDRPHERREPALEGPE